MDFRALVFCSLFACGVVFASGSKASIVDDIYTSEFKPLAVSDVSSVTLSGVKAVSALSF
jgi:hypothetical protein